MINVWGTRYRLLLEQLEQLADRLGAAPACEPGKLEEKMVRLLMGIVRILRQHEVNQWGRCRFCGWTRWGWRIGHLRPRCTVYRELDFAMTQPMDVVWWQLFKDIGQEVALDEVREWIQQREQAVHKPATGSSAADDDDTVMLERRVLERRLRGTSHH